MEIDVQWHPVEVQSINITLLKYGEACLRKVDRSLKRNDIL